jgi:hypothetical protein
MSPGGCDADVLNFGDRVTGVAGAAVSSCFANEWFYLLSEALRKHMIPGWSRTVSLAIYYEE